MSSEAIGVVYDLRAINTPRRLHRLSGIEKLLLLHIADAWGLDFDAAREHLDDVAFTTCLAHSRLLILLNRLEELCLFQFGGQWRPD